jgi:hypothetical protein
VNNLVESEGGAHGRLDDQRANVLPVLLKKRDKEVGGHHDLGGELVLGHLDVANSDGHAENLLKLELDGGSHIVDLGVEVLVVGNGGGELTSLGELGSEKSGNLLDQSLGGNEGVVLLGELLDELLVLVELLEILNGHSINTNGLGSVDIESITKDTDGHVRSGDLGELDGSRETLVSLGVVVLETNLELNGLEEVSLLGLGLLEQLLDVATDAGDGNLRGHFCRCSIESPKKLVKSV